MSSSSTRAAVRSSTTSPRRSDVKVIEANDSSNWLSATDASATDFDSVTTLQGERFE